MMPSRFGRYEVLSKIASGGMAEIFRARSSSGKIVAIKKILSSFTDNKRFITMFVDEAKIMVSLKHPNVVQVYEFGLHEEEYFLTMEWVDGRPLSSLIRRQINLGIPFPVELAVFITLEILCGLEYVHNKKDSYNQPLNLIHRDLSPPNILISREGEVKIADFGIAKARGKVSLTQPGILKGKFSYMSPEQAEGEEIDQRSDLFSCGIMLHEMLSGRRLFLDEKEIRTIENVRRAKVAPPGRLNPEVPPSLDFIALKALAKRTSARYQTAGAFAGDVEYLLTHSYAGTNSGHLKSFMQYLYPNVALYPSPAERADVIAYWERRFHHKARVQSSLSEARDRSGALPSQGEGWPEARPGPGYLFSLALVGLASLGLLTFDLAQREPLVMARLRAQKAKWFHSAPPPAGRNVEDRHGQ